jgi:hypothetical protein
MDRVKLEQAGFRLAFEGGQRGAAGMGDEYSPKNVRVVVT